MIIYIVKSAACMAIFFVFYKLLLEKENMHFFKRFYLLVSVIASLLIPSIVFMEYVTVEPVSVPVQIEPKATDYDYIGVPEALEEDVVDFAPILWAFYFLGLIYFSIRFIRNLGQIIRRIAKNPKQKAPGFIYVLLKENFPPHTFFKYIFFNKKKLESNQIPKEVLLHEETHARQRHSYDILFIELVQVVFWFNPLIILFKKAIKLNHEFLADQAVLNKEIDQPTYQNTLLSYLSNDSYNNYQSKMANAINYSSIKNRFTVMKKTTSKTSKILRTTLLIPLIALLTLGFSEKRFVEIPIQKEGESEVSFSEFTMAHDASDDQVKTYNDLAKRYNEIPIETRTIPLSDLRRLEKIYKSMTLEQKEKAQPFPECLPQNQQKGASREQMATYNALAKKYNEMSRDNMHIKMKEVERMKYIYNLMSEKQKADSEPFPEFPEPPAPPKAPQNISDRQYASNQIDSIIKIQDPNDGPNINLNAASPPPPPAPPSPLDHVIEMANKGADFYYEGKKISSDKAIELLKKNKGLNIDSRSNNKKPTVRISKDPIKIGSNNKKINVETGNIRVNGKELFYTKKDGITAYFNKQGQQVDKEGQPLTDEFKRKPVYYFNGEKISSVKAHELLRNNTSIQVTNEDITEGEYAIVLTDLNDQKSNYYNQNKNQNALIDLSEMISKDASFFYNDEPISTEKALWLTQNDQIERVQTIGSKNGAPKVYFWKKI